ncbi:MAG: cytochrome c oxidase accessory protein CcoG [Bacteroidia bacterium]|nr:cytochrome c oxidase accessory protein CcoG [Bacteroidia bacterium]
MNNSGEANVKEDSFRDSISTISKEGKRNWIYPKKPKGFLHNKRIIVSIILLIMLFSGPFWKWDGHAMFLFNVLERKFIIFGIPFWPQDFFLFVLAMLTFFVFIILFTAVFGRVWCGWACPQTIFMEMVFRKIEYAIEGDSSRQKALAHSGWTSEKIRKKFLKHSIFFLISFLIANTFLAYLIGVDKLGLLITEGPGMHLSTFVSLVAFTGVFYGVYARFREQVCLVVCPYGRLQGVLLDRNSVVIAYDYKRGEARGKIRKDVVRQEGDCIDCHQCVHVCPTGIDIRNGTQLECVNCTACIDACNDVMDKVGFKKGLIRFASENSIASGLKFKFTARIAAYSAILVMLLSVLITLLVMRSDVETSIQRTPGQMYQSVENDRISNLYNVQIINKTFKDLPLEIRIKSHSGEIKFVGEKLMEVKHDSETQAVFFIILPRDVLSGLKTKLKLGIYSNGKEIDEVETNFLGPN